VHGGVIEAAGRGVLRQIDEPEMMERHGQCPPASSAARRSTLATIRLRAAS
jgi:hypothetical protein